MADSRTLKLTFQADTTNAENKIRNLNRDVQTLERTFQKVVDITERLGRFQSNTDPFSVMNDGVQKLQTNLGNVQSTLVNINNTSTAKLASGLEQIASTANRLQSNLNQVDSAAKKAFNTVQKTFNKEIQIKFDTLKIPEITVKAKLDDTTKLDFKRQIDRENNEIKLKQRIQRDNDIRSGRDARAARDAKANEILNELRNEAKKPKKNKKGEDIPDRRTDDSGFISDALFGEGKKGKGRYFSEAKQKREKEREERRKKLEDYQSGFGSFRKRATAREQQEQDKAVAFANERIQQKYQQIQADKIAKEKAAREYQQKIEKFSGIEGNRFTQGRGIGYGISNLSKGALENRASVLGNIGNFGRDVIESRSPMALQNVIQGTSQIAQGLNMSRVAALGVGAAISLGIVGAIETAIFLVGKFQEQLEVARRDQLAKLGVTSETMRLSGVDLNTANNLYERIQTQTSIAGRDTSVSAEDIIALNRIGQSAFERSYAGSGQSLDSIADKLVDVNKRFAILGQTTSGVTPFQIQNAYTSAVSGNLGQAVKRQEFFRNSGFDAVINEIAASRGTDLTTATNTEQIEILSEALKTRVPDSLINRAQKESVDAQFSRLNDFLFDNRIGVFGIQRDTDLNTEGIQSVFSEFSRSVNLLIGEGGLFDELGVILSTLLPDYDIMNDIRLGFKALNDGLEALNNFLKSINDTFDAIERSQIGKTLGFLDQALPKPGETIASVPIPGLSTLATNAPGSTIGGSIDLTGIPGVKSINNAFNWLTGGLFKPSHQGNLPTLAKPAASGFVPLLSAIQEESRNKPVGSNLIIANDSELILNQHQLQNLFSMSAKPAYDGNIGSKMINISEGAIVVNAPSGMDTTTLANTVISELERRIEMEI